MRRISPALPLVLVAVGLCAAGVYGDDLLEDKPVKKAGVSIELPKGWQVDDHAASRSLVMLARAPKRDKDTTGEFQAIVAVDAQTVSKLDGKAQQDRIGKACNNYKVTEEPATATLGGVEGIMFGGTFTQNSVKLRARQYMILQDNKLYIITFTTLDSTWPGYVSAIEACAASFAISAK